MGKTDGLNKKDKLFNDILEDFNLRHLGFSPTTVNTEGILFIQTIVSALWYVTNGHDTILNASLHNKDVDPIPSSWQKYQGYDDFKRKRKKCKPILSLALVSHAQALLALCLKPIMKTRPEWKCLCNDLKSLAECFQKYSSYLQDHLLRQQKRQAMDHPVRQISEFCTMESRTKGLFIEECYRLLDECLKFNDYEPVCFDEAIHSHKPFLNNMQRYRFIENLQLSSAVNVLKYSPGGSIITVIYIFKIDETWTNNEKMTHTARIIAKLKPKMPEYHTRQMKKYFRDRYSNLASVSPSIMTSMYKELALDSSAYENPEMQSRIDLILQGEIGIIQDLRKLNPGRPSQTFEVFFGKLEEVIAQSTAEDERRHNVAHFSSWISLRDLIAETEKLCPPSTPIPSKALVRLQFTPKNPYSNTALQFTSRFNIQHKIQRRQLRSQHPDNHYCAAQFQYMKYLACMLKDCVFVCADDKAKIPIGEPGHILSTGVRGKQSIVPVTTTLVAEDHDVYHRGSLTPSIYLFSKIPDSPKQSFYSGKVEVVLNDSVFESSNPFRHSAAMLRSLKTVKPFKILMKFSDGGTDQRNTLESVKCSLICLFKELDLDMLIAGRCSPGQSWINPVERIMSTLNLALQNCALAREECSKQIETVLKKCGSMVEIREKEKMEPNLKVEWGKSILPLQQLIRRRFERLQIKNEQIKTQDPILESEIDTVKKQLLNLFPDIDLTQLNKKGVSKCTSYIRWIENHCNQALYCFQIRKCSDLDCCSPPSNKDLIWLPNPILQDDKVHFKCFNEVYMQPTDERDRPSLKPFYKGTEKVKKNPKMKESRMKAKISAEETVALSAQNARTTINCVECQKPRIIYSSHRLSERQTTQLMLLLSEFEYTCGSQIVPPTHTLKKVVYVRNNINCSDIIELPYYSSELGRKDICCYCGLPDTELDLELKKIYKTVLPLCTQCSQSGLSPVCYRSFGK